RPTDDSDKINYPGMARIADLGELVLLDVVRRPVRPEFLRKPQPRTAITAAKPAESPADPHAAVAASGGAVAPKGANEESGPAGAAAARGSTPECGEEKAGGGGGGRRRGGMPGSPAEKAGLKKGDIIVKFAGKPVGTLQDYTEYLKASKPGDKVG